MGAMKWGFERIEALLEALGNPQDSFESVHIAGTNGKGSTAAFLSALLVESGHRVGMYTSPHLDDIRERFVVDGAPAGEDVIQAVAAEMLALTEARPATYFECATALAFAVFRAAGVDWAVVETGLGGRLDATNVLTPRVAIVTTIGLDHAELLGSTLQAIAAEKGGIFKPGVPAVIGEIPTPAGPVLEDTARRAGAASFARLGERASVWDVDVSVRGTRFLYRSEARASDLELRTGLVGRHQAHNAGLALLALEAMGLSLPDPVVSRAIEGTRIPGRFEVIPEGDTTWVFDIAHNREGIDVVIDTLHEMGAPRPWVAVAGILADKPWSGMLGMLRIDTQAIILTQPGSAPKSRRWNLTEVARQGAEDLFDVRVEEDLEAALVLAREIGRDGTVLVTGSAYTVGEARRLLSVE